MGAADDQMAPIIKLGQLARAEGTKDGFTLRAFGIVPDLDAGGPTHAHLVFEVDPDHDAGPQVDPALLTQLEAPPDDGRRADEARKRLTDLEQQLRDHKKGILGD